MLSLYHNGISTCSQKVRVLLAEKELEFESHSIDLIKGEQHDPEYVRLNPNHVVPTLVHDERVLIESSLINEYLDEAFPDPPMRPDSPYERHALRLWVKRVDDKIQPAAGIVTFAIGPRILLQQQPEAVREANIASIPDPARRAARRSVIEHGVQAPEFAGALERFLDLLDDMEKRLSQDDWLCGSTYGLADIVVLPYVLRLHHLAMDPILSSEVRPKVADWFARMKSRPSFETAVAAWLPEMALDLFRGQGEAVWPEVATMVEARG